MYAYRKSLIAFSFQTCVFVNDLTVIPKSIYILLIYGEDCIGQICHSLKITYKTNF